jgi:2-haloacid dehalogenase
MSVDWVTFDCYGTLIDWESGVYEALAPLLPRAVDRDALAARYIAIEADVEHGGYLRYRDVLDRASRALLTELGAPLRPDQASPLPTSLPRWRPFPEVPDALRRIRDLGYRWAILSNVDRDLLEASIERLGIAPDLAVTAEDCGSYKPAPGHWRFFETNSEVSRDRVVHVGASLYHDIVPASTLGYRTVFIDRHGEGARDARASRVLADLSALPEAIEELALATP